MREYADMVQLREPEVDDIIGFMDGVSFSSECTDERIEQNASKEKITNDKTNLEKELQELKELKRKYVSNVGQVIINNIIQELENKYKESLVLNEKLSKMKELEGLLIKR